MRIRRRSRQNKLCKNCKYYNKTFCQECRFYLLKWVHELEVENKKLNIINETYKELFKKLIG